MKLSYSGMVRRTAVWWLFAVLAGLSNFAWAAAGYVHEMVGDVRVQYGAAAERKVAMGDIFDPGATFHTGANGVAVIKFEDGQIVSLQPNTAFRVEGYSFNVNNPKAGSSALRLLQGAMRFVTGIIGSTNHNNVKLAAGTATIGIRGTDVSLLMNAATQQVLAMIAAGAVLMETPEGSTTINRAQYVAYKSGAKPTTPQPAANAPAGARTIYNALLAAPIPKPDPVVVRAAARAAAKVAEAREAQAKAAADPGNGDLAAAAAKAAIDATGEIQKAVRAALAVLAVAIDSGAVPVSDPGTPTFQQTIDQTLAVQQISQTGKAAASNISLTDVNNIIGTPPPTTCSGSNC